ncbi:Asp-tRNA(Asn)/Glu-tRNA(Gln) amidotransferase subunit GatC [Candidatus Omnitrophota bacterium]
MDIEYVAQLARINLSQEQKRKLSQQLSDILAYIEKLKQLNVDQVEPISHALPLQNVFRQDKKRASLAIEKVLSNAPAAKDDSFSVPRVIE